MDCELKIISFDKPKPAKGIRPKKTAPCILNLCFIGGPAFHHYARRKESTVMITSIYEINRLIEDKKRMAGAELGFEDEIIKAEFPD
jgi:hypothetical protein